MSRTPSSAVGLQTVSLLFGGDSTELLTYPLTPSPPLRLFSRYVLSVHTHPEPSGAWRSGVEGTDKGSWLQSGEGNRPHSGKTHLQG